MSSFSKYIWTVSGVVGGFSAGTAVSGLLRDKPTAAAAASPPPTDQLFGDRITIPKRETQNTDRYGAAIQACRELVFQTKEEMGIPGICVAVNVNGKTVWTEGFGYADVENAVPCTPNTVMRIASISKSLTMAAMAKLLESGKIDLDQSVQHYVPKFPPKIFQGEEVDITTRMLVSHLSGIRHWKGGEEKDPAKDSPVKPEFYLNTQFKTIEDALTIFQNDELLHKPGTKYFYSSPAWTLISAVMETAAGKSYREIMTTMFNHLGLRNTKLDENEPIVLHRARYYVRNKNGRLINSPCVDNSCKWAGGGLQSTVGDLVKFGDAMLYCYQGGSSGYLKKDTIDAMWTVSPNTLKEPKAIGTYGYGMGWFIAPALNQYGGIEPQAFSVNHTGGAVGASSILYIAPCKPNGIPTGVTIGIIVNMQGISLTRLAKDLANCFSKAGN